VPVKPAESPCNKGEWLQYSVNAFHHGCTADIVYDPADTIKPVLKWKYKIQEEGKVNPPIITEDAIYVTSKNKIVALYKNGTKKWGVKLVGNNFIGSPAIFTVKTPKKTAPVMLDGGKINVEYGGEVHKAVVSATDAGQLLAYDAKTGLPVCDSQTYKGKPTGKKSCWPAQNLGSIVGSPVVHANTFLYVSTEKGVYRLDNEGNFIWFKTEGKPTIPTVDIYGNVYVGTSDGYVYRLEVRDGRFEEIWKKEFGSIVTPIAWVEGPVVGFGAEDVLVVSDKDGKIFTLLAKDGTVKWVYEEKPEIKPFVRRPAVIPVARDEFWYNFTVLAEADGKLYYLKTERGEVKKIWGATTAAMQTPMLVSLSGQYGTAYYVDKYGFLKIYEVSPIGEDGNGEDGKPIGVKGARAIHEFEHPETVSMPVISDDTLYVGGDGYLYAFVVDKKAPTYSNQRQLNAAGEKIEQAFPKELVRLCADWKDDKGLVKAKLVVDTPSRIIETQEQELSGKERTVCFDYTPEAEGVYGWHMEVWDVSNMELTGDMEFAVREEVPGDTEPPVGAGHEIVPEDTLGPSERFKVNVNWADDKELGESGIWICVSKEKYGCEPKHITFGPTSKNEFWEPEPPGPESVELKEGEFATVKGYGVKVSIVAKEPGEKRDAVIVVSKGAESTEPIDLKVGEEKHVKLEEEVLGVRLKDVSYGKSAVVQLTKDVFLKDPDAEWEVLDYKKYLYSKNDVSEFLIGPWATKFRELGQWPQNRYVSWLVYACDKADEHAGVDGKWRGGTSTVGEGKSKLIGDYTVTVNKILAPEGEITAKITVCRRDICTALELKKSDIGMTRNVLLEGGYVPVTLRSIEFEKREVTVTIGKPAKKRCNAYLVKSGHVPSLFVPDVEPPVIKNVKQDKDSIEPEGDSIVLSADVSDNVELKTVEFVVGGNSREAKVVNGKASIEIEYEEVSPEIQGGYIDWFVRAEDSSGNLAESEEKSFRIIDRTKPEVEAILTTPKVREGDLVGVTVTATDNYNLESVQLYVDGKPCTGATGEGKKFVTGKKAKVILTCPAPTITTTPNIEWQVVAKDEFGNEDKSPVGVFRVLASCKYRSSAPPFISMVKESNTTVLPGEPIIFTAEVSDDVDEATGCGGVERVWLEVQGEDGLWRWAGDADIEALKKVYSEDEERWKIEKAKVEINWTSPKFEEYGFLVVSASSHNMGVLGRIGGIGGVTGLAVAGGKEPSRPLGLPGTSFKWRFVAVDTLEHKREGLEREIFVKDVEAPELMSVSQEKDKLVYTEKMELESCWRDNGQLAKIIIESDELGKPVNKTFDVKGKNAWAFQKLCYKYSFSNPKLKLGTVVHWRAFAEDMGGNQEVSSMHEFKVVSEPPEITAERTIPENPLKGELVKIEVDVTDDVGLKEAVLETNETGIFKEYDRKTVGGTSATVQFEWSEPEVAPGTVVAWRVKVIDLDGNVVESHPEFVIQPDTVPPTITKVEQSADRVPQGSILLLSAELSDNAGLSQAILETDEDGTLRNRTSKGLAGRSATVTFEWQNPAVEKGKLVKWRIYAVDASGNSAASKEMSFTITEAAEICPVCPPPTEWGRCTKGQQSRAIYICDETTGFLCEAKVDTRPCEMSPADLAFDAITDARNAISVALAEGKDVSEAQLVLIGAELAYADEDYATAKAKAEEAKSLAEAAVAPFAPIDVTYVLGAILIVAIVAVVAVFAKKKQAKSITPVQK